MNYYKVVGRITATTNKFLSLLQFKNIKEVHHNTDEIEIEMKEGPSARIRFLSPDEVGFYWSVNDFETRAEELEGNNWNMIYDKSKFLKALHDMKHNHDCNYGITWDSIDSYLDNCKFKQ